MAAASGFQDCPPPVAGATDAAQLAALKQQVLCLQQQVSNLRAPVRQTFDEAQIANYRTQIGLLDYRLELYHWQHFASNFMMVTATAVVWVGLALSAAQLIHAMRIGAKEDGTFEANVTGLKITSSVTGLLILGMSLAFVYLFLHEVYAVHEPPLHGLTAP